MDTGIAAARTIARDCGPAGRELVQNDEYSEFVAAERFQLEAIRASRALPSLPSKTWAAVSRTACVPSAGHLASRNRIAAQIVTGDLHTLQ